MANAIPKTDAKRSNNIMRASFVYVLFFLQRRLLAKKDKINKTKTKLIKIITTCFNSSILILLLSTILSFAALTLYFFGEPV